VVAGRPRSDLPPSDERSASRARLGAVDHRQIVRMLAAGRVAVGVALLVLPGLALRPWLGVTARDRRVKVIMRAMGARDLVLGIGALRALDRGEPVRPWAVAGATADLADAGATLAAIGSLGPARALPVAATAGAAAAAAINSAGRLD